MNKNFICLWYRSRVYVQELVSTPQKFNFVRIEKGKNVYSRS